MGTVNFLQEEDFRLETSRARLSNILKRHEELAERVSRDSDKSVFERLQKEFEAARASQTQETVLDGDQWNDGLLATIRERVHMEVDRKAMPGEPNMELDPDLLEKTTYKVGNKKFIDHVGELIQAYVDRREQVRLIKELYGKQIRELYHSLPCHMIEFVLIDVDCQVNFCLRYADLLSVLPTRVTVLAWPIGLVKKSLSSPVAADSKEKVSPGNIPACLSYVEDTLKALSLPLAYAEIVLNLPQVIQQLFPSQGTE